MENAKSREGKITIPTQEGRETRLVFTFTKEKIIKMVLCFFLPYAGMFSQMHPLGIAFYGAIFSKGKWAMFLAPAIAGSITSGCSLIYPVSLIVLTVVMALWDGFEEKGILRAIASGCVFLVFSTIKCSVEGLIVYELLAVCLESFIVGASLYVFFKGGQILLHIKKRSFLSQGEVMYAYTCLALIIFSLNAFPDIWNIRPSAVVAMVVIFAMCSSRGESGAIYLAIILGVIGSTQSPAQSALTSTYAFGALLSYRLKSYGKTGIILGFVLSNTLFSLFLTESFTIVMNLYDSFVAALIFCLLPQGVMDYFGLLSRKGEGKILDANQLSKGYEGARKLQRMADSFQELADIYKSVYTGRNKPNQKSLYPVQMIKEKVCVGCQRRERCFSKDGPATRALEKIKDPSVITGAHLPKELKDVCHRCDSFAQIVKNSGEKVKVEKQWANKLCECKELIALQLEGISRSLNKSARELSATRDEKAEEKLWSAFDSMSLCPCMIYAEEKEDGEFEIEVYFECQNVEKSTKGSSLKCIEKALEAPVDFAGTRREKDKVVFVFCPRRGYSASFGYATKPKSGEKVCGDSFNVFYSSPDKMVMMLSDGMGCGEKAARESRETVSMMEKFLGAGFECELCAQLINSSLVLKGNKESFSTLDVCHIDLSLSSLSFIKLGASCSYIKTEDKISKIRARSLPAGILSGSEPERHMLPLESDTAVILMSDGIADLSLKYPHKEGWIEKELEKISPITNPQIIAGRLIDAATKIEGGKSCDDMTVVVSCISKKKNKGIIC